MFAIGSVSRHGQNAVEAVIAAGGALVGAPIDPIAALKLIALYEVDDLTVAPRTLERMVNAMERHNLKAPSVKRVGITGSVLGEELVRRVERAFTAEITSRYGTTEAGRIAAGVVTSATYRRGYVGQLRDGVTIVSAGTRDKPAPIVMANDLARQAKYIVAGKLVGDDGPTITLPDLGYVENGALYVVGRADEVFNFSGNKIAYDVIEQEVERQPGVRAVAIASAGPIGRDDDLVIGVVADGPLDLSRLSEGVLTAPGWRGARSHLHFFQLSQVPLNQVGKIDRQELLRLFVSARSPQPVSG
jgi:acyl-coenzyme A synthetase/AMP-(fatty) acid ligase